jgi:putative ABC transport system permease protein
MSFLRRLTNLGRSERLGDDINRELSFHMREQVEELIAQGMSERDAIAAARRRFGNPTHLSELTRDQDVIGWIDSVFGDLRYGLRALRRSPVFTAVAIASLALGIGANTAIYSLMDAIVIRALPVPAPEQLAQVIGGDDDREGHFTNHLWEQVRDRQTGFDAITAFSETSFNIADGGEVRRILGMWASGDFFSVFGMQPATGRLFTRADDVRGCPGIGVLGYGFWQSEYGGRADVIGKTISITGKPFQIVGVAAPGFVSPEVGRDVHLYAPLCSEGYLAGANSGLDRRSRWWLRVIGRRGSELSMPQAIAMLKSIAPESYAATIPPHWAAEGKAEWVKRTFSAIPAESGMSGVRDRYGKALRILMGAVGLVLLIACANVANLLIARAAARQREVAIRLAMGAARRRIVRQLLTESAMLAVLGAVGGLFVAQWATRALVALISTPSSPVAVDLALNTRVLGFTALIASLTALLFGLVPAWRGTRISPHAAMKSNARGVAEGGFGGGHGRFNLGKTLVAAQVALSLTLLVGAGLLIGSLRNLRTMDPGFNADGVLLVSAGFGRTAIPPAQLAQVQRGILEQLRATPGVRSASISDMTPISGSSWNDAVYVEGAPDMTERERVVWFNEVRDSFFATLDIKLLAGRDFDATDVPGQPRVAVVDEEMGRKFFGSASPLGRQFRTKAGDSFSAPYTIVGVVETSKYQNLREKSSATIYLMSAQNDVAASGITLLLRTDGDPMRLVPTVKRVMAEVHRLTTVEFRTLSSQVDASLRRERMLAWLSGLFGAVALALSMLGLYGVMAYTVARRRNEIGVRIALGADNARVLRMVLGDVARVVLIGLVIGAVGAVASGKLVTAFLFGLEPAEPLVLASAALILFAVALSAGFIPALRASRVDPVAALRED